MAGTLGIATLDTQVDLAGLDRGLSDGRQTTERGMGAMGVAAGNILSNVIMKGATMAFDAVVNVTGALIDMTMEAAQVEGVKNTFDSLVASVGGDTVQAMEDLRQATRGMVTDADLMAASNKFLAMGIASTTDEAAALAEVATQLGSAMGEDATDSMENFALMMSNQSLPRLDSFGISSGAVRERILELMDATEGLTREQAFNMAVMEQAEVTMGKVGEQGYTTAAGMARFGTMIENVKLTIGQAFLPVLDMLTSTITQLATWALPLIQDAMAGLSEVAQTAAFFFGTLVENIMNGMSPIEALMSALRDLDIFTPEQIETVQNFITTVLNLKDRIMELLQPVIDAVAKFVSWKDILIVLGAAIAAVVLPIIYSIVTAIAPVIAAVIVAIGIVALLRNAWENDWGGIRTFLIEVWETKLKPAFEALKEWLAVAIPAALEILKGFWENTLLPALNDMRAWLAEKVPEAIQTLTDFWENVLLPAIQDVWAFIQDPLMPLFATLWELLEVTGGLAITALQGLWENVLLPALTNVWTFIQEKVLPIFTTLFEFFRDRLEPILIGLGGSFDNIKGAVEGVITIIGGLVDLLRDITLPDWLTPGSPTPFEIGLVGIGGAMSKVNAELSDMAVNLFPGGGRPDGGPNIGTNIEAFNLTVPTTSPVDTTVQSVQMAMAMAAA